MSTSRPKGQLQLDDYTLEFSGSLYRPSSYFDRLDSTSNALAAIAPLEAIANIGDSIVVTSFNPGNTVRRLTVWRVVPDGV
jgi:hypothetical protein